MRPKIKNTARLLDHGDVKSRSIVLKIAEETLQQLDSYHRIKAIMRLEEDILHIGERSWDLSQKRHIYLVGAGKACNAMAMAVDEILGDRLTRGIAIVKIAEETDAFCRTEVFVGGHPLPNEEGLKACQEIIELVDAAGPQDLFIVVISGGSSALMSCPIQGITLQDEIDTTDVLLKSGAGILEINAIRRHISQMNGGMLAKRIERVGAELIGIGISDAIGTLHNENVSVPYANYKGTPMGPDPTTFEEARRVITDYNMADRLPKRVVDYIMHGTEDQETPKAFPNNTYFMLNTLPDSCMIAKEVAKKMGIQAITLTNFLEGESKDAGIFMASLVREIQANKQPFAPPCLILSAGETTTTILDNRTITGHGGPSQELTIGFAISAAKTKGACVFSIDTEGTDGTSLAAGGITDSQTLHLAQQAGYNLYDALRGHATFETLDALGDAVITGNTGTNLCDLNILYVPAEMVTTNQISEMKEG